MMSTRQHIDPMDIIYDEALGLYQRTEYKPAFVKWLWAAEAGHAPSMHDTADCYRLGHGVQQDYVRAQDWYRKAVAGDQPKSMAHLGTLLKHGFGSPVDKSAAVKLWSRAAERGSQEGIRELAYSYLVGDGIEQNYEMSAQLFQRIHTHPQQLIAAFELGIAYELGRGVPLNLGNAARLYQHCITYGSRGPAGPAYMFASARFSLMAFQSPNDDMDAFRLMTHISQQPVSGGLNGIDTRSAHVWLGWMYAVGRGAARDISRALTHYQRARNDSRALRHIALLKSDSEARPVMPIAHWCDPADQHLVRGLGRGRWSIVNLIRTTNDYYWADKELRTRDIDLKRELTFYSSLTEDDSTYVLVPTRMDVDQDTKRCTIRYPYMSGGSLADVMTQYHEAKDRIPEATLIAWAFQMVSGLEVIYLRGTAHRHLTPRNILFTDEKRQSLKIADVGVIGSPFTSPIPLTDSAIRGFQSTYVSAYAAPEQLAAPEKRPAYTISADLWALGQILVEAICGQFSGNVDGEPWLAQFEEEEISGFLLSNRGDYSDPFISAVLSLLRVNPDDRYTIDRAVAALSSLHNGSDAAAAAKKVLKVSPPQPIMGPVLAPLPVYNPNGSTLTGSGSSLSSSNGLSSSGGSGGSTGGSLSSGLSSMSSMSSTPAPRSPSTSLSSMSSTPTTGAAAAATSAAATPSPSPAPVAPVAAVVPKRRDFASMTVEEQWQQILHDKQPLLEWHTSNGTMVLR